jgi:hypothetical protein
MSLQGASRLAFLGCLSALALIAQTGSGKVQGVVKDTSSAVVAGANVALVHTDTTQKFVTTTNEVGLFTFPPVQPGAYEITVDAPGMQTWAAKLLLVVGQTAEVSPILKVGAITTQVVVAGEVTALVTTTDATLSRNLEHTRIEQLPQNGRNIANLVLVNTPGLVGGQDGAMNPMVNGLRDSVELYQDGAVIKNRDTGDWSGRLAGVDSVEELRVETSLSSAKFDRPGSVILSTRSGGNKIHGTLFETNRNSGIGVARRRQDYYAKPPHYVRNEFGGSIGGPVFLPKIYDGRNRTFFFTSYELNRIASSSTTSTTMPTMAMRDGDFSGLVDNLGRLQTLYDPWSTGAGPSFIRSPYVGNKIPASQESPVAKYLYSVMPAPTNGANPLVDNNYFGLGFSVTNDYMSTSRIDHRIGDNDQIFGRVTVTQNTQTYSNGVPANNNALNVVYGTHTDGNGVASWNHSFSPSFLSETRVAFSKEDKFVGPPPVEGIQNMADYLKMPNPGGDPFLAYQSYNNGFGLSYSVQQMRQNITSILGIDQNFTRVFGRHELQFGGKLRHEYLKVQVDGPSSGSWYSNQSTALFDPASGSSYNAVPLTGANAGSFHIGAVSQYQLTVKRPPYDLRDRGYSGYIQDNWKPTSRLTLNFGLRYEFLPAMNEKNYYMASFDKKTGALVLGRSLTDMYQAKQTTPGAIAQFQNIGVTFESADAAGLPAALVNSNPWVFEPRIGFAYKLTEGVTPLVLRGGYGIYDSQVALRVWDNTQGSLVPFGYPLQYQVNDQSLVGDKLPNYALRSAPEYVAGTSSRGALDNPKFVQISRGIGIEYTDPHQPPSKAHEWNVSFGREIFRGITATASYVGTHAVNLPQKYNFNAAPNDYIWYMTTGVAKPTGTYASVGTNPYNATTYGTINVFQRSGYSNSNAFQFEAQRRYANGVGFQFMYELTNALTNSTFVGNGGGPTIVPASTYLPGAVPADFDALNRQMYYTRDTAIPHHQLRWNWVADLPFGKGKMFAGHAGKALNSVIGGWQVAGSGSYRSRYWTLPTSNWGSLGEVQNYGTQYPIQDCSSGSCIPGYLAWNGYISPPLINRTDANGKCTGICGVPSNYTPSNQPLIPYGATALPANAPSNTVLSTYWDTQTVWVKLQNASVVRTTLNTNYHPWRNQYMPGPWSFGLDASLFKTMALSEVVKLRFNADFFSVLNNPGMGTPGGNGILSTQNSSNSPRVLQLSLRLSW